MLDFLKKHQADIILVIGVFLISLLSFALGYIMAKQEKEPLKFEDANINQEKSSHNWRGDKWTLFG